MHGLLYNREVIPMPLKILQRYHDKNFKKIDETNDDQLMKQKRCKLLSQLDRFLMTSKKLAERLKALGKTTFTIYAGFGTSRYNIRELFVISAKWPSAALEPSQLMSVIVNYFITLPKPKKYQSILLHFSHIPFEPEKHIILPFKCHSTALVASISINSSATNLTTDNNFGFDPHLKSSLEFSAIRKLPNFQTSKTQQKRKQKFSAQI